jgi:hypothetical protein
VPLGGSLTYSTKYLVGGGFANSDER